MCVSAFNGICMARANWPANIITPPRRVHTSTVTVLAATLTLQPCQWQCRLTLLRPLLRRTGMACINSTCPRWRPPGHHEITVALCQVDGCRVMCVCVCVLARATDSLRLSLRLCH